MTLVISNSSIGPNDKGKKLSFYYYDQVFEKYNIGFKRSGFFREILSFCFGIALSQLKFQSFRKLPQTFHEIVTI